MYGDRWPQFEIMYGKELTQEELKANLPQHHTVGWEYSREGGQLYPDGEWEPYDSWKAQKIVRPSYHYDTCVTLTLHIFGTRKKGKLRASRWYGTLKIGSSCSVMAGKGSCKSISDAFRQADKLDLEPQIRELLKKAYSHQGARAIYKATTPPEPFVTMLRSWSWDLYQLPPGEYMDVHWFQPMDQTKPIALSGSTISRRLGGYCSGGYLPGAKSQEEHNQLLKALGTWVPHPNGEDRCVI